MNEWMNVDGTFTIIFETEKQLKEHTHIRM